MATATASRRKLPPEPATWIPDVPVNRDQPLPQQVYGLLRRAIIEGRLAALESINEPAVAQFLDVSRTPVREALLRLKQDGLVEIKRQSGTFVAGIDRQRVEEGIVVRESLEPRTTEIAARLIGDEALSVLERETGNMASALAAQDFPAFIGADDRFHSTLLDASGFMHIREIIEQVNAQLDRLRYMSASFPERPDAAVHEHRLLIERLVARDAEGSARCMHRHLQGSWIPIRKLLDRMPET